MEASWGLAGKVFHGLQMSPLECSGAWEWSGILAV